MYDPQALNPRPQVPNHQETADAGAEKLLGPHVLLEFRDLGLVGVETFDRLDLSPVARKRDFSHLG